MPVDVAEEVEVDERRTCNHCGTRPCRVVNGKTLSTCAECRRIVAERRDGSVIKGICNRCHVNLAWIKPSGVRAKACRACLDQHAKTARASHTRKQGEPENRATIVDVEDWCEDCQAAGFHRDGCPVTRQRQRVA